MTFDAMEVWLSAVKAHEGCATQSFGDDDQAAAAVIAQAFAGIVAERDAAVAIAHDFADSAESTLDNVEGYSENAKWAWGAGSSSETHCAPPLPATPMRQKALARRQPHDLS